MSIIVPIEIQLSPRSRNLIDAIVNGLKAPVKVELDHPAGEGLQPPALGAYWPGQGGFYAGKLPAVGDRPEMHMVFSEEETESLTWGPRDNDVTGTRSRHDGRANTQVIIMSCAQGESNYYTAKAAAQKANKFPAAQWAANYTADGHKDFHLPSQLELFMASLLVPEKFKKEGWYWSSTQGSADGAFVQAFEYGYSFWCSKAFEYRVRAVRWIPVNP